MKILYVHPRGISDLIFSLPLINTPKREFQKSERYIPSSEEPKSRKELFDIPLKEAIKRLEEILHE